MQTVILDCCHSLGQTRAPQGQIVRCFERLPPIGDDEDTDIIDQADRGMGLARGTRGSTTVRTAEATHMLLAACQQDQFAGEVEGQGVFTKELLRVLRSHASGIGNLTYASVMLQMRMPDSL
jgi:uncharacterized caspase-like protein